MLFSRKKKNLNFSWKKNFTPHVPLPPYFYNPVVCGVTLYNLEYDYITNIFY